MKVISNSSILIGLSAIGRLELLHRQFPEGVIVPDAVWQEVVETGHGRAGADQADDRRRADQVGTVRDAAQAPVDRAAGAGSAARSPSPK